TPIAPGVPLPYPAGTPVSAMVCEDVPHSDGTLNYAEREAMVRAVEPFVFRNQNGDVQYTLKSHVGEGENDFQLDIANRSELIEYSEIINTASAVGLQHVVFGPQNSAISSRTNATDMNGLEELLWLGLGEQI